MTRNDEIPNSSEMHKSARRRRSNSPQIEKIAAAYCGENRNATRYEQAFVIAQCDVAISQLRAQAVKLMELLPASLVAESNGNQRSKRINEVCDYLEAMGAGGQVTVPAYCSPDEQDTFDKLKDSILHFDRLMRLEERVWLRRKRALRAFLANHKRSLPTATAASINRPVSPKLKTELVAPIRPE